MGLFDVFKKKEVNFPFRENPNLAIITCCHIIDEKSPILYASHDVEGDWQFLCGRDHVTEEARVTALYNIYKLDNSISKLADMKLGGTAVRNSIDSDWQIKD